MQRIVIVFSILLALCAPSWAVKVDHINGISITSHKTYDGIWSISKIKAHNGFAIASGACDTSQFSELGTTNNSVAVASSSANVYRASKFVYNGTNGKSICKILLRLSFTGTNAHQYYAAIYSNGATWPDSAIGTSDALDLSSIGGTETDAIFTLSTPSSALTNGSTYWIVLYSATYDADDYANWAYTNTAATEQMAYSGNGTSWSDGGATNSFKFELCSN